VSICCPWRHARSVHVSGFMSTPPESMRTATATIWHAQPNLHERHSSQTCSQMRASQDPPALSIPSTCASFRRSGAEHAAMEREWLIGQQIDRLAAEDGDIPGMLLARLPAEQ